VRAAVGERLVEVVGAAGVDRVGGLLGLDVRERQVAVGERGRELVAAGLGVARTATIEGAPGTQLPGYLAARVTVPASTLQSAESDDFVLPPPMSAQ
jgi:hypothetical protein